jgi:hypothetical protein
MVLLPDSLHAGETMSTRAESLSQRITQGADELSAYAGKLSDEQWQTVVSPDGRLVGVIIHHVASVYPIEVHLAQEVAAGKAIAGITWAAVAEMNALHAQEHHTVSKEDAVALLRRNSREAASAVSAFSDEQLNSAAPVSLNAGAPLTAQFLIEDHAIRHSWHHLAGIRAALQDL